MHNKSSQLPQDLYHRLYWYVKRNVDPGRIAAALDLPIKTAHHLISRLATKKDSTAIIQHCQKLKEEIVKISASDRRPLALIDAVFKQHGLDASIPIFGTELAFEEHAFR